MMLYHPRRRRLSLLCRPILTILFSVATAANATSTILNLDGTPLHIGQWGAQAERSTPTIILLSGPTDNWQSDTAWFARLGPHLGRHFPTIAIDRPGQFVDRMEAPVGYISFAESLAAVIDHFTLKEVILIAFASSNLTLNHYFHRFPDHPVKRVVMVDPDVLTATSIARYKQDALSFKQNLDKYLAYVGEGRYTPRLEAINRAEYAQLQQLAGDDPATDWDYVDTLFAARLLIKNQLNHFRTLARYDQDLDQATAAGFPETVELVILDTDFEQTYIEQEKDPEVRKGLTTWRQAGVEYYQGLVERSPGGRYIPLESREHLIIFSKPELIVELLTAP